MANPPDRRPLPDPTVTQETEPATEDPDDPAVARPTDGLASRDVRKRRVSRDVRARRNREVDGIERRREHLDDLALRVVRFSELGTRAELLDQCRLHDDSLDVGEPKLPHGCQIFFRDRHLAKIRLKDRS